MDSTYLIENFVSVTAGNPFRVFPFGVIYKNGVKREITPEFAKSIKLPHFKAPIKLSSHDDNAPAGGFITALEVREDGLYVVPEWNEAGLKAMQDGAYRYNSPEILWSGGVEDPKTGDVISAPMILGTALLHMPHLGEATALYSIEPIITEETTMEENITVPKSLWDKFVAPIFAKEPEVKEVVKTVEPEDYAATKIERDELKAKFETQETEAKVKEAKAALIVELQNKEKFGMTYIALEAAQEAADMVAGMTPEQREWCMRNFSAFIKQIDESKLTSEVGNEGGGSEDPKAAFNAIVLQIMKDSKLDNYNAAFEVAKVQHADLFKAWAK